MVQPTTRFEHGYDIVRVETIVVMVMVMIPGARPIPTGLRQGIVPIAPRGASRSKKNNSCDGPPSVSRRHSNSEEKVKTFWEPERKHKSANAATSDRLDSKLPER